MKVFGGVIILFVLSLNVFAQKLTPKAIEKELLKSFNKITYWKELNDTDTAFEKLIEANDKLEEKLIKYTQEYPFTITQRFDKLSKCIDIKTSEDGLLRIYTWDTLLGGRQPNFSNVFQYRSMQNINSVADTVENEGFLGNYACDKLHTLTINNKKYYLLIKNGTPADNERGGEIKVLAIENGTLNNKIKLIKTKRGLTYKLSCRWTPIEDDDYSEAGMIYDAKTKTIKFPLVSETEKLTGNHITYKFTGKYFEKIK